MTKRIKVIWKKLNVSHGVFDFICGGDDMIETSIKFYDRNDKEVKSELLKSFFEEIIYDHVEFYEASSDTYLGESGEVIITLNSDETKFQFTKTSMNELVEGYICTVELMMSNEMVDFIKTNIRRISGIGKELNLTYYSDYLIKDGDKEMIESIQNVLESLEDYIPGNVNGDLEDWYTFDACVCCDKIEFHGNRIQVRLYRESTYFEESSDNPVNTYLEV